MDARRSLEQATIFHPITADRTAHQVELLRHAAMRARDEAIARGVARFFRSLGRGLAAVGSAVMSWPNRHQTYENLRALTDRELADIGLTRGEISRVFDPEFRMPAKPAANGNSAAPAGRPAAA